MKYLPVTLFALLMLTGCRSAGKQYEAYSPPDSYDTYSPPAGYENGAPPVDYGGSVSAGGCPSCH